MRYQRVLVLAFEVFAHFIMSNGIAPRICRDNRHFCAIVRLSPKWRIDTAGGLQQVSPDVGKIRSLQSAVPTVGLKLACQSLVGHVGFGDDQKSTGVLVEPVHDAWPAHAADARQAVSAMGKQRIDERTIGVASAWMHDEAGRLVDDNEGVILIDDRQGNSLRRRLSCDRLWFIQTIGLVLSDFAGRLQRCLVVIFLVHDMACLDQRGNACPAHVLQACRQKAVQSYTVLISADG